MYNCRVHIPFQNNGLCAGAVFSKTYLELNREEEEQLYRELGKMDKKDLNAA